MIHDTKTSFELETPPPAYHDIDLEAQPTAVATSSFSQLFNSLLFRALVIDEILSILLYNLIKSQDAVIHSTSSSLLLLCSRIPPSTASLDLVGISTQLLSSCDTASTFQNTLSPSITSSLFLFIITLKSLLLYFSLRSTPTKNDRYGVNGTTRLSWDLMTTTSWLHALIAALYTWPILLVTDRWNQQDFVVMGLGAAVCLAWMGVVHWQSRVAQEEEEANEEEEEEQVVEVVIRLGRT